MMPTIASLLLATMSYGCGIAPLLMLRRRRFRYIYASVVTLFIFLIFLSSAYTFFMMRFAAAAFDMRWRLMHCLRVDMLRHMLYWRYDAAAVFA